MTSFSRIIIFGLHNFSLQPLSLFHTRIRTARYTMTIKIFPSQVHLFFSTTLFRASGIFSFFFCFFFLCVFLYFKKKKRRKNMKKLTKIMRRRKWMVSWILAVVCVFFSYLQYEKRDFSLLFRRFCSFIYLPVCLPIYLFLFVIIIVIIIIKIIIIMNEMIEAGR